MIRLSQDRVKTLLAIHGWSGILLGLLLYAVVVTGVISVFTDEIGDWSSPAEHRSTAAFPVGLDGKLRELAGTVDPQYYEDVSIYPRAGGRIQAFFHKHVTVPGESVPEEEGVQFTLDPHTLNVLERHEGMHEDIHALDKHNALADFLVELHVSLHIPDPWGYFVTGILGLALMVAATTGLFVHRHLLRDLFTLRRMREALLVRRDKHVIAGTWALPFAFVLAFTGSFYSFASSVSVPAMAMVAFGGNQMALFETIVGLPPPENKARVPHANLDGMFEDVRVRTRSEPAFASISNYGRADSQLSVFTYPSEGSLFTHNVVYEATTGKFLRDKPTFGLVPSVGGAAADLMAPLHFGNFAGVLSKSVWFVLGFATCYVTLTGLLLWTTRRAESPLWRRFERIAIWMGYGLPLSLGLVPHGYFAARAAGMTMLEGPMVYALSAGAAIATAIFVICKDPEKARRWLLVLAGIALVLLPITRLLSGSPGWFDALDAGVIAVPALDITLIVGGALCLIAALQKRAAAVSRARVADEESEATA